MNAIDLVVERDDISNRAAGKARHSNIWRAVVSRILESGAIIVRASGGSDAFFTCDFLIGGGQLVLKTGDSVLVLAPSSAEERGVVLGLVGSYQPPAPTSGTAERLTVQAAESLALKCGESSIELHKDGKVLVKGKDIVSRAQRVHRIKGGTVAIN